MALIGMSRTWALELAPHNVTVNVIAPGPVATELFKQASPPDAEQTRALLAATTDPALRGQLTGDLKAEEGRLRALENLAAAQLTLPPEALATLDNLQPHA